MEKRRLVKLVRQNTMARPDHFKEYEEHGIEAEILHNASFNKGKSKTQRTTRS